MIKALVRDGQPFHLLGQQIRAGITEHVSVYAIESHGIRIHGILVLLDGGLGAEGSGHAGGRLGPSGKSLGLARLLGGIVVGVAGSGCGVKVLLRWLGSGGRMEMLVLLGEVENGAEVGGWRGFEEGDSFY